MFFVEIAKVKGKCVVGLTLIGVLLFLCVNNECLIPFGGWCWVIMIALSGVREGSKVLSVNRKHVFA